MTAFVPAPSCFSAVLRRVSSLAAVSWLSIVAVILCYGLLQYLQQFNWNKVLPPPEGSLGEGEMLTLDTICSLRKVRFFVILFGKGCYVYSMGEAQAPVE